MSYVDLFLEKLGLSKDQFGDREKTVWNMLFLLVLLSIFISFDLGIQILGLPLTTQKIGMAVAAAFLLFFSVRGDINWGKAITPIIVPLFLITLGALLATILNSQYPLGGLKGTLSLFMTLVATLVWFGLVEKVSSGFFRLAIFLGIPVLFIFQLSISISNYLATDVRGGRMRGLIGNPNETGGILIMALPLLLSSFVAKDMKIRILGTVGLLITLVGLFFTYSRASYLVAFAFFLIFIVGELSQKNFGNIKRVLFLLVVILIIGGLGIFSTSGITDNLAVDRFLELFQGDGGINFGESSLDYRIDAVKFGFDYFVQHPIFGEGPIDFNRVKVTRPGTNRPFHAFENTYIHLLATTGLVGFLSFLSIIGLTFWVLFRNTACIKDRLMLRFNRNLIYVFVTFLVMMLFNDYITATSTIWIWVWIAFSLNRMDQGKKLDLVYDR